MQSRKRDQLRYTIVLKIIVWVVVITIIVLNTLTVFDSLSDLQFIFWHSLHIIFPLILAVISVLPRFEYIVVAVAASLVVLVIDVLYLIIRVIDLFNCRNIPLCNKDILSRVWLTIISLVFILTAIWALVVLSKMWNSNQGRDVRGRVHALGSY